MKLTDQEKSMLDGDDGELVQEAMAFLLMKKKIKYER